jgi:hypothetical protein
MSRDLLASLICAALSCCKPAAPLVTALPSATAPPSAAANAAVPPASPPAPDATRDGAVPAHVVDLAIGSHRGCVVLEGGRVGCWSLAPGAPRVAVPVRTLPPAFAVSVGVGQVHACSLLRSRTMVCWGSNTRGELGIGQGAEGELPTPVLRLTNVSSLALAWANTYAVDEDGRAWSWGASDAGVLGESSTDDRYEPGRITMLPPVRQIAAGGRHTCALTRTGDVLCWGSNELGELGVATPRMSRGPLRVAGIHGAIAIGLGEARSCAVVSGGWVMCWGQVGYETPGARRQPISVPPDIPPPEWGDPADQLVPIMWTPTPSAVPGLTGAVELSSRANVDCVRAASGAECWSAGVHGPGSDALPPTHLPIESVVRVVAGPNMACALDAGGVVTCFAIEGGRVGPGEVIRAE